MLNLFPLKNQLFVTNIRCRILMSLISRISQTNQGFISIKKTIATETYNLLIDPKTYFKNIFTVGLLRQGFVNCKKFILKYENGQLSDRIQDFMLFT